MVYQRLACLGQAKAQNGHALARVSNIVYQRLAYRGNTKLNND